MTVKVIREGDVRIIPATPYHTEKRIHDDDLVPVETQGGGHCRVTPGHLAPAGSMSDADLVRRVWAK